MRRFVTWVGAALAALAIGQGAMAQTPTLYQALGGEAAVRAIARETIEAAAADPSMADKFKGADLDKIARLLAEQLCAVADGGCTYTGRSMAESHEGIGATKAQFYALVEHLQRAMEHADVPFRVQNRLLARLAPMSREIVER